MIDMVVSDLDGTLRLPGEDFFEQDLKNLELLGKKNIVRVIATGRSLFSAKKVISPDFPIDYLIFSSGAGIMEWSNQELIFKESIPGEKVRELIVIFQENQLNYMVHGEIPLNHFFYFQHNVKEISDFEERINLYSEFARPLKSLNNYSFKASQALVIIPDCVTRFQQISSLIREMKVIRTTSPLDGKSIWLEVFPRHVSKGAAVSWLCRVLKLSELHTLGIGNDYNDLDLLERTGFSWVVSDSPQEMKNRYRVCSASRPDGFSAAVENEVFQKK